MDDNARRRLEDAAKDLHPHREADANADAAHRDVAGALDEGVIDGLRERLDHYAIELEANHPTIAGIVREIIDDLSAIGI